MNGVILLFLFLDFFRGVRRREREREMGCMQCCFTSISFRMRHWVFFFKLSGVFLGFWGSKGFFFFGTVLEVF